MQLFFISCPQTGTAWPFHGAAQALHHLKQEKQKKKTKPQKHQVQRNPFIAFTLTTQLFPSHMQLDLFLLFMLQLLLTKHIFFTHSLTAFTAFLTEVVLKLLQE